MVIRQVTYEVWFKQPEGKWWKYTNIPALSDATTLKNGFKKQLYKSKIVEITVSAKTIAR